MCVCERESTALLQIRDSNNENRYLPSYISKRSCYSHYCSTNGYKVSTKNSTTKVEVDGSYCGNRYPVMSQTGYIDFLDFPVIKSHNLTKIFVCFVIDSITCRNIGPYHQRIDNFVKMLLMIVMKRRMSVYIYH